LHTSTTIWRGRKRRNKSFDPTFNLFRVVFNCNTLFPELALGATHIQALQACGVAIRYYMDILDLTCMHPQRSGAVGSEEIKALTQHSTSSGLYLIATHYSPSWRSGLRTFKPFRLVWRGCLFWVERSGHELFQKKAEMS